MMLRQQNIFSIKDVEYAIFETNGKLSVMKYDQKQAVTKEDMNITIKAKQYPFSAELVSDGKINTNNLTRLDLK
ncbi:uncharacterized membrane protein YcaP (DUF421 family) [Natronobacillus azotifigens]|uniref:DUF421 domain-containing protein n=1 Tax=Natronobacillus azotifigens TaxID=472978 RepID=UPI00300DE5F9